ncbi:hypothetical protein [Oricola sp.]|uniref:DUF7507 domain-containing protein n=1 Tax=Oricola sp. TaxID=1979950 RepID=UPI0025E9EFD7|nr:hypothetical protein [Oricola sp.]MCI5076294.1 hypothetical protein [Oricola sp.]
MSCETRQADRHLTRAQAGNPSGSRARLVAAVALAPILLAQPAWAEFANLATATARSGETAVEAQAAVQTVQLAPAQPGLSVSPSLDLDIGRGADTENADEGDVVTVTVTVANTGDVATGGVVVDNARLRIGYLVVELPAAGFDQSSAELGLDASATFVTTHTLTTEQVYRAVAGDGIVLEAGASGTAGAIVVSATADPVSVAVPAHAQMAIVTTSDLSKAEGNTRDGAEAGDQITFTYLVENTGNTAIEDVAVTVDLAGKTVTSAGTPDLGVEPFTVEVKTEDPLALNADTEESAGVYDVLGPGGAVTFIHVHTLTQAEYEAQ